MISSRVLLSPQDIREIEHGISAPRFKNVGVDFGGSQLTVPQQAGEGIDIDAAVKLDDGKGMTRAVEGDLLGYTRLQRPPGELHVVPSRVLEALEDPLCCLAWAPHQLHRHVIQIQVLQAAGLFLGEDDTVMAIEGLQLGPGQLVNVGPAQASATREQKGALKNVVPALGLGQGSYLVFGQVNPFVFLPLDSFDTSYRIIR